MTKLFLILVLTALPALSQAALPIHYERVRIMSFVLNKSAELFPFDPIDKIELGANLEFEIVTEAGCIALVRPVFGEPDPGIIGPAPLKDILVLENSCN